MTKQDFFSRYTYNVRTDKIGGGSFGTVYKAYDNLLHREVAIKVSEVKIINGKEFSLKDEFDAIKNLPKHPNIANYEELHTFDTPQGVFDYAVMQFYPEGNLAQSIAKGLSFEQKEDLSIRLLEGIVHLHNHKIVHRDLKPGNILIVKHDQKLIPLITDFGLSKQVWEDAQSRFSMSFGGGTLKYSSPEQLRGEKIRLNTDLWSYGVVVHEIFTSESLFRTSSISSGSANSDSEILAQINNKDLNPEIAKLPEKWMRVVSLCLVRDNNSRVKSAEELLNILSGSSSSDGTSLDFPPDFYTNAEKAIANREHITFVDARNGTWNHNDWVIFVKHLNNKYGQVDEAIIGKACEAYLNNEFKQIKEKSLPKEKNNNKIEEIKIIESSNSKDDFVNVYGTKYAIGPKKADEIKASISKINSIYIIKSRYTLTTLFWGIIPFAIGTYIAYSLINDWSGSTSEFIGGAFGVILLIISFFILKKKSNFVLLHDNHLLFRLPLASGKYYFPISSIKSIRIENSKNLTLGGSSSDKAINAFKIFILTDEEIDIMVDFSFTGIPFDDVVVFFNSHRELRQITTIFS